MLGGNDIGPKGEFQLIFVSIFLLLGAIINSIIFGNMAVILQSLNRKSTEFQEKLRKQMMA
jgi:ABC-type tungstate transport system substrate-binding protein